MTEKTVSTDIILVVIDDRCGLCSGGARRLARWDKDDRFRIVPMHSDLGRTLLKSYGLDPDDPVSWLYLDGDSGLTGFEGWARVGQVLGGLAQTLRLLLLIPAPLRQRLYYAMARNRMRFFGTDDLCRLPEPAVARRLVK